MKNSPKDKPKRRELSNSGSSTELISRDSPQNIKKKEEALSKRFQDLFDSTFIECPKVLNQNALLTARYLDLSNFVYPQNQNDDSDNQNGANKGQKLNASLTGRYLDFKYIPENIVVLRLTATNINSLQGFPLLHSLRTLYLDSCDLITLDGMPAFPKLRYLYLNNNILVNYKGMPILPELALLDMTNNAADFKPITALQACGSIGLTTFNSTKITAADIRSAFKNSPLVGAALRAGLDIDSATNEEALDYMSNDVTEYLKAKDFTMETPKLTFTGSDDEGWFVVFPIQLISSRSKKSLNIEDKVFASDIKWYMNSCPVTTNGEEWELITTEQVNMIEIKNTMYQHIIKATFKLNDSDRVFTMYTDNVVGYLEDTLILPFPVTPRVSGDPREGSLISTIPMPVPTKSSWYVGDETDPYLEDSETLTLSAEHIGKEISCIIKPYCPEFPKIRFNELITKTEIVTALQPTVKGISFPQSIVEGEEFHMQKIFTPDREGNSRIVVERAKSASQEWLHCARLNPTSLVYTPTNEDVGCFLRLVYEPILDDGKSADEPFYFYATSRVLPCLPTFKNARLAGDFLAGRKIIAIGDYAGGRKGECVYQWYTSSKPFNKLKDLKTAKKVKTQSEDVYLPGEADIGRYIACVITPIRDDDVVGDQVFATSDKPIEEDPQPPEKIDIPKKIYAFKPITLDDDYNWFISSTEDEAGFESADSGVGPEFTPNERHVGKFIRITKNNDPKCSYILGKVFHGPSLIPDFKLNVTSLYDTGIATIPDDIELENYEILWIRMKQNQETVVDVDTRTYTFTEDDIGAQIKVGLTHISTDTNERGEIAYSEPTKKIQKSVRGKPVILGKCFVGNELSFTIKNDTKGNVPIIESCRWLKSRGPKAEWQEMVSYKFLQIDRNTEELTYTCVKGRDVEHPLLLADLTCTLTDAEIDYYIKVELTAGEYSSSKKNKIRPTNETMQAVTTNRVSYQRFTLALEKDKQQQDYYYEGKKINLITKGCPEDGVSTIIIWERLGYDDHEEEQWTTIAEGLSYQFTPDDVEQTIRCRPWLQKERVSNKGNALLHPQIGSISRISNDDLNDGSFFEFADIRPRAPQVSDVEIEQSPSGRILVSGLYKGGREGNSQFFASYIGEDRHTLHYVEIKPIAPPTTLPDGKSQYEFYPWSSLFQNGANSFVPIDIGYKPVRDDNKEGETVWSNKPLNVYPIPFIKKAYITSDSKELCAGDTLKCFVNCPDANKCDFEWIIQRNPSPKEEKQIEKIQTKLSKDSKQLSDIIALQQDAQTSTIYDANTGLVTYTIFRSETFSYTISEYDNDATFKCTIWATGSNGMESKPFSSQLQLKQVGAARKNPRLLIGLSQDSNESRTKKSPIKANKRASASLQKSERKPNVFYSGDIIEPIFEDLDETEVFWTIRDSNEKFDQSEDEREVISSEEKVRINASYVGKYIEVHTEDEKYSSQPIGPILINPDIESLSKASSRANTFRFKGRAPIGNGQWECQLSQDGLTITGRNKVSKKSSWKDTNIVMVDEDQLEITNGPGSRFIMVPSLDERDKKEAVKSVEDIRDLIYTLYLSYKNAN